MGPIVSVSVRVVMSASSFENKLDRTPLAPDGPVDNLRTGAV